MAFKLAQLFVEIGGHDGPLQGVLRNLRNQLTGLSSSLGTKLALAAGGLAIGAAITKGVKSAIDLNETLSKTDAVLGESSTKVKAFADEMAEKFGLIKKETLDAASAFGGLGKGLGQLQGDKLSDFTIRMTKMAADLQSFANLGSMQEAAKAIQVGLSGEQSDTLKQLGVTLLETQVEAQALAMGFRKVGGEFTNAAKLAAREQLILRGLADAMGDLERTADSPANMLRKLTGSFDNLLTEMGAKFMPVVGAVAKSLAGTVGQIGEKFRANEGLFDSVAQGIIGAFDTVREGALRIGEAFGQLPAAIDALFGAGTTEKITGFGDLFGHYLAEEINGIGSVIRNLPEYFELAAVGITEVIMNLGDVLDVLPENLSRIGDYIAGNWKELIIDGVTAVGMAFFNLNENIENFGNAIIDFLIDPTKGFKFDWKPLLEGFEATAGELPELLDPVYRNLDDRQKELWDKIEERDKAAMARIQAAAQTGAGGASAASKAAQDALDASKKKPSFEGLAEFKQKLALEQEDNKQVQALDKNTEALLDVHDGTSKLERALKEGLTAKFAV